MAKTKKNYTTKVVDGRMTLTMNEKKNGRLVSASCDYPLVVQEIDEADGKVVMVRKTKAQTEKWLLQILGYNA